MAMIRRHGRVYRYSTDPSFALSRALTRLRVFESERADLDYAADDARGVRADHEMPPEYLAELALLQASVTRECALFCGEFPSAAGAYADTPTDPTNPYNVERVRLAAAIAGFR